MITLAAFLQAIPVIQSAIVGTPTFKGDLSDPKTAAAFAKFTLDHDTQLVQFDVSCPWDDLEGNCTMEFFRDDDPKVRQLVLWVFANDRCFPNSTDAHERMLSCHGGNVYFTKTDTSGTDSLVVTGPGNHGMLVRGAFLIRKDAYGIVYPENIVNYDLSAKPTANN